MSDLHRTYAIDLSVRLVFTLLPLIFLAIPPVLVLRLVPLTGLPEMYSTILTLFLMAIVIIIELPFAGAMVILNIQLWPAHISLTEKGMVQTYGLNRFVVKWDEVKDFEYQYARVTNPFFKGVYLQIFEIRSDHHFVRFTRHVEKPHESETGWLKVFPVFSVKTWNIKQFGVPLTGDVADALLADLDKVMDREPRKHTIV